jgi:hypothetical protein
VPREVKGYSANVLASSLGLDPRHYRLRPGARQRHEGAPVVERIRLGGRQVPGQAAGRPGDVHFGHALGSACHHAGRIERHAQVSSLRLREPADKLPQSERPGLGRVQDDLDVRAGTLTAGTGMSASSGATRFHFRLFSLPITYPCSILA